MDRRIFLKKTAFILGILANPFNAKAKASSKSPKSGPMPVNRADIIDFYSHFSCMRTIAYLEKVGGGSPHIFRTLFENTPTLIDVEKRLELMDMHGIARSVLVPLPWIETMPSVYANPRNCLQAAKILNNTLAEITAKRPDRFSAVALLPTTNADIMAQEFERGIKELNMAGGFFVVGPTVKRPDHPDYEILYKMATEMDVPLWLHPSRPPTYADYKDEKISKYQVWQSLSWLHDSSAAMVRIVFGEVFHRYPEIKLIIHHHGAMIPLFARRMQYGWDYFEQSTGKKQPTSISEPYIEHFKKFYCDTATQGISPQLLNMAADFFGSDRMVFGSDAPMDPSAGSAFTHDAIASVLKMDIPKPVKQKFLPATPKSC